MPEDSIFSGVLTIPVIGMHGARSTFVKATSSTRSRSVVAAVGRNAAKSAGKK
jgi:hypothetical protein